MDAILDLTRTLVAIPSQAGVDTSGPMLIAIARFLDANGLRPRMLADSDGDPVALITEVVGSADGPTICLNACADTAPAGDLETWTSAPFDPTVRDGWLYGRGAADSKVAIAMFCHLGVALAAERDRLAGRLLLLFDGDEHTGEFGGVKALLRTKPDLLGVMIGYPDDAAISVGARGVYRCRVVVHGRAEHSGKPRGPTANAIDKAAHLIVALQAAALPEIDDPEFPLPPKISVTAIHGGSGFSVIPDRCEINVDFRLTPAAGRSWAEAVLADAVWRVDRDQPTGTPTDIIEATNWAPYKLPEDSVLRAALTGAAAEAMGHPVPEQVCGPSNVGNLLASSGIEATCGFGVRCSGVHGANEGFAIDSIQPVYRTYEGVVRRLLGSETAIESHDPDRLSDLSRVRGT